MPAPRTLAAPKIRYGRASDGPGIARLFATVFGRERGIDAWRWQSLEPGGVPRESPQCVVATIDREIVGHYGAVPVRAVQRGRAVVWSQGVDSMVHPDVRGTLGRFAVFLRCARAFFERWGQADDPTANHATYGLPNAAARTIGIRRLGYRVVRDPVQTLFLNAFAPTLAPRPIDDLIVVDGLPPAAALDALWAEVAGSFELATVRDHRYLSWRYLRAPTAYGIHHVVDGGGRLRAVFVTKQDYQDGPILAVVDYLGREGDRPALHCALDDAVHRAPVVGAGRIEMWFPDGSWWWAQARALGMGAEPTPFALCVIVHGQEGAAPLGHDWYWTLGDGDSC